MPARALPVLAILMLGTAVAGPLPNPAERQSKIVPVLQIDTEAAAASDDEAERRTTAARILSASDREIFTRAFDAADRGDWPRALAEAAAGKNPVAKALVQWRYLQDKNARAPFPEIDTFLKSNPDWPKRSTLLVRAEEALDPATTPANVIAWYGNRNPISAIGLIRLGDALIASGKTDWGRKLVRDGWAAGTFDPMVELAIVQKDGSFLTPDVDKRRVDNLIWSDQFTAARRAMARVDETTQRIANARIALRSDPRRGQRALSELSADLASDPKLLFDRARAARKNGDFDVAADLLTRPAVRELFKGRQSALWPEAHIVAREMLKAGKADLAYRLVADSGMTGGSEYADAEFLSGWIALRFLNNPQMALPHFVRLTTGVTRPISVSRGNYWQGRSYEALGDTVNAYKRYEAAAKAPETFYGQLALTRIEAAPVLRLTAAKVDAMPSAAAFEKDELVKAMRVLADLGSQNLMRVFMVRYLELHPGPGPAKQLAAALTEWGYRDVALRLAKVIGYDGPTFPQYAYPTVTVPEYKGPAPAPEAALVHAIIRQETEFDPQSVSHANARGIMQLTLAAARVNAKRAGLPYRPNALISDVHYNMQLGMTEFSSYLNNWGNSIIVSAAAYNAGEGNAKRWIQTFGDPRQGTVDPIDWIESITYGETRNYVQRIVENLQVYRSRLAGRDAPLKILSDLYANPPQLKVLSPPPPPPPPVPVKKPKLRR